MYCNDKFEFGASKVAKVIKMATEQVVRAIKVEIEQHLSENSSFVGSGIGSGGRSLVVFTFEEVNDIDCGLYQLEIDGTVYVLTNKQVLPMQKDRRYTIKKSQQQTVLYLE